MARILITGSSTGLGLMAGQLLIGEGHEVVLHGRTQARAADAMRAAPGARTAIVGDLSSVAQMRSVAEQANRLDRFDAVIHNAAVGYRERTRIATADGLAHVFAVNVLAPYVLTALVARPDRLVYLSSELHRRTNADPDDLNWTERPWNGTKAYAESKVHDVVLAFAVARRWPAVRANAIEPGWVATRMGGPRATGDLAKAHVTQAWLATSQDPLALSTGEYFFHKALRPPSKATRDEARQEALLAACERMSGVGMPV